MSLVLNVRKSCDSSNKLRSITLYVSRLLISVDYNKNDCCNFEGIFEIFTETITYLNFYTLLFAKKSQSSTRKLKSILFYDQELEICG